MNDCVNAEAKSLKARRVISTISIILAVVLLAAALIGSRQQLDRFVNKLSPMLGEALTALSYGDTGTAHSLSIAIRSAIREASKGLKLTVSHRDLTELLRASDEAVALGGDASKEELTVALNSVRSMLEALIEIEKLSVGNIM